MSTVKTTFDTPGVGSEAAARDRTRELLGRPMGFVAVTVGFAALGAYLGRDLTGATGLLLFIAAFACIFALNSAATRGREQLAIPAPAAPAGCNPGRIAPRTGVAALHSYALLSGARRAHRGAMIDLPSGEALGQGAAAPGIVAGPPLQHESGSRGPACERATSGPARQDTRVVAGAAIQGL
jgi:hypothetical protein